MVRIGSQGNYYVMDVLPRDIDAAYLAICFNKGRFFPPRIFKSRQQGDQKYEILEQVREWHDTGKRTGRGNRQDNRTYAIS